MKKCAYLFFLIFFFLALNKSFSSAFYLRGKFGDREVDLKFGIEEEEEEETSIINTSNANDVG